MELKKDMQQVDNFANHQFQRPILVDINSVYEHFSDEINLFNSKKKYY